MNDSTSRSATASGTAGDRGAALDAWVDAHFDDEVAFLQALVRVPSDTPPGDNRPAAERAAELLDAMGLMVERHAPPADAVAAAGLASIVNLVVRQRVGEATGGGPTIALNVHGDVVPPGDGWTHDPYGGEIVDGRLYGRGVAVSKSDFATYAFALRAVVDAGASAASAAPRLGTARSEAAGSEAAGSEAAGSETAGSGAAASGAAGSGAAASEIPLRGTIELHLTYDEEFGGLVGPAWLLSEGIVRPDIAIGPGFSYAIVTAHNGCLQLAVTIRGRSAHAAMPETGVDAIRAATAVLAALYADAAALATIRSAVDGIGSPTLNVGLIGGGINTNVVPDRVTFKLDRRMIPEEDPDAVEAALRATIERALPDEPGLTVEVRRLLRARALKPLPGHERLVDALQAAGVAVTGSTIPTEATPLYTDARLYGEAGIPIVLYGAGPRSILEANAKRADEHLVLDDLRRATKIVARALADLLAT